MRKLAMAGALAIAGLAWVQDARAAEGAQQTREEMRQTGEQAERRTEQMGQRAQERMTQMGEEKRHPIFGGKENYELEGKIQKVSKNSITLQREELPAVTLSVSQHTKIEVEGQQASVAQLKQGQDVKASFNLQGDKPMAVEIKAEKLEGARQEKQERQQAQPPAGQQQPGPRY